ncbi:MAG: hypothetical protein AB1714_06845 [Acidobacteriota bacterium]
MSIRCGARILGSVVLVGLVLPLCIRYTVSGDARSWRASHSTGERWYDPFTGYWVRELPGRYTEQVKVEMLGDVVSHSAQITCKVLKNGAPAPNVRVDFALTRGPHKGWARTIKTGSDGIARAIVQGDEMDAQDHGYVSAWVSSRDGKPYEPADDDALRSESFNIHWNEWLEDFCIHNYHMVPEDFEHQGC